MSGEQSSGTSSEISALQAFLTYCVSVCAGHWPPVSGRGSLESDQDMSTSTVSQLETRPGQSDSLPCEVQSVFVRAQLIISMSSVR